MTTLGNRETLSFYLSLILGLIQILWHYRILRHTIIVVWSGSVLRIYRPWIHTIKILIYQGHGK